ncbi:MAG: sulfatase-like hydrolase/transferase [Bryobacteraceae bacterium]
MTRREWLGVAAGALNLPAEQQRPNIVLILADDLGYIDLGCAGNSSIHTPHIDKLASQGIRFTDFVVSWPACTPSRSSILTGRYPQRNGLYDMIRNDEVNWKHVFTEEEYAVSEEMTLGLDVREVTIGQVMRSTGYATGVFGKWDSGRAKRFLPLQRGFDDFYGFANTGIDYYTHERYRVASMFRGNERIKEQGHATDLFKREALRFIDRNHRRPFFLYLPFNAPHGASTFDKSAPQVPEKYLKMYAGDRRAQYKALITHMDDAIGEILARLDQYRLSDNTLIVFASDNGGTGDRNGKLRGGKGTLWEGGFRVPMIARFPGRIPAGVVSDQFASTLEFLPTCAKLAGAHPPKGARLDGFDMMPLLENRAPTERREMYWQRRGDKAARVGEWKWIESAAGGGLFQLSSDPGERKDLSAEKPDVLAMVKGKWRAWRKEMDESEPRGPFRNY